MHTQKIIGIIIVSISLGLIAYQATRSESTVTFFTPAEVFANPLKFQNKTFRVSGLVLAGSKNWDAKNQLLTFRMSDLNGHDFLVSYKGLPPDLFKEKQGVIVEGRLQDISATLPEIAPQPDTVTPQLDTVTPRLDTVTPRLDTVTPRLDRGAQPLHLTANLLMVKHSEVYNTQDDHSQMREVKLRESLFQN